MKLFQLFIVLFFGWGISLASAEPANPNLKHCVLGDAGPNGCHATTVPADYDGVGDAGWNDVLTDANGRHLTGWYDRAGAPCTGLSDTCVYQLKAKFLITCPGGSSTCQRANTIAPFYILRQLGDIPGAGRAKDFGTPIGAQPANVFQWSEIAQAVDDAAANCAAMGGEWIGAENYCNFLSAGLPGLSKHGMWTALEQECTRKGGEFIACKNPISADAIVNVGCGPATACTYPLYKSGGTATVDATSHTFPAGNCFCRTEFFSKTRYDNRTTTLLANRWTLISDSIAITDLFPGETKARRYRITANYTVLIPDLPAFVPTAPETQDALCKRRANEYGWDNVVIAVNGSSFTDARYPKANAVFNGGLANYGTSGTQFLASYGSPGTGGHLAGGFSIGQSVGAVGATGYRCIVSGRYEFDGYIASYHKFALNFFVSNAAVDIPNAMIQTIRLDVIQDRNIGNSWR